MMLIRAARLDDSSAIASIYAPVVLETATSFELEPPDAVEFERRMTTILERFPWLVAERDGVVVGYAYAGPHRARAAYQWSAEVSVYIDRTAHRCGIGRRLYDTLFATLEQLGYRRLFGGITLPNAPENKEKPALDSRLELDVAKLVSVHVLDGVDGPWVHLSLPEAFK